MSASKTESPPSPSHSPQSCTWLPSSEEESAPETSARSRLGRRRRLLHGGRTHGFHCGLPSQARNLLRERMQALSLRLWPGGAEKELREAKLLAPSAFS